MCSGILVSLSQVEAARDDLPVADDEGTDGNFALGRRSVCEQQGLLHEVSVKIRIHERHLGTSIAGLRVSCVHHYTTS